MSKEERIVNGLIKGLTAMRDIHHHQTFSDDAININEALAWLEMQGANVDINPSEFEMRLNKLLKQFESLSKEDIVSSLSFYLNVIQNDGTYKAEEKQDEQKHFDYENANIQQKDFAPKQEPKFKVGDFIVYDYCMGKVVEITNDAYLLDIGQGIPFSCEDNVHLWTIKDANEGNIIAGKIDGDNYILIFKTIKDGWIETYGHYYNAVNRFCVPSQLFCRSYQGTFTPATKEQRDLLFAKMEEAGYEWDADKKELKIVDWSKHIKYEPNSPSIVESKREWSETDENMANDLIKGYLSSGRAYYLAHTSEEIVDWLKSIKDRVKGEE